MDNSSNVLNDLKFLSSAQKALLRKCNFKEASDVLLIPSGELSKRLKVSLSEAQSIFENVCKEIASTSAQLERVVDVGNDKFTTGDASLDSVFGGGIRTGMVWELSGESASGKTQFALQLSLLVQVRPILGGLSGSACYFTTHCGIPTKRLAQLATEHPLLSPSVCSLSDVHTIAVPTIELMTHTLKTTLLALQSSLSKDPARKPVRLVVIDSVSALFHTTEKPTTLTLVERSKSLSEISRVMHSLAARDNIAFVVINEVTDVFHPSGSYPQEGKLESDVVYRDQARWFNSAHSIPGENLKEASLGLVWANQLNARIMFTRTNRRRYPDEHPPLLKRRRVESEGVIRSSHPSSSADVGADVDQPILIRRLSVIFSSVSMLNSVDFVITKQGLSAVAGEVPQPADTSFVRNPQKGYATALSKASPASPAGSNMLPQGASSSSAAPSGDLKSPNRSQFVRAGTVELPSSRDRVDNSRAEVIPSSFPEESDELEDGGLYWEEFDDLPYDALSDTGFDGLESAGVEGDVEESSVIPPSEEIIL
ncbi:hypothetical protein M0805_003872 [Coniferiporia weirii]|nr:hypothetical protein M0805_003872 [Coniferiporia weirii]